ncbi:MAG: transporter substrate-binding domain-containing protein [Oscillospiraceae bacterium]|nr:transporter substrate-binding domain-containing protein [Oscillospiraceae bacterium]
MKKITALLLVLALAFAFAGCGAGGADTAADTGDGASAGTQKVLRVGMECGYAPYNWAQPTDANGAVPIVDSADYAYGYDVMIAKYLADKMGCTLEIHKIDWDSLPLALQAGTIDCVIAGQSITAERLQTVDFTTPYYYASIYAVTTKDGKYADAKSLADLAGATCTSQLNTVWYDVCLPQIKDANILPAMESAPQMFVALDAGKCDLVVTDEPAALGALAVYDNFVMLDLGDDDFAVSDEEINIGISVKKGNSELLDALNAGLATLTTDDFTRMMNEAIQLSAAL